MARRTQEQAQATRQRILESAAQLFAERGWAHSAMQEVAHRAGVTRGAVYWHFRDQNDLLEALLDETQLPWQVVCPWPSAVQAGNPLDLRQALVHLGTVPLAWLESSVPAQRLLCILGPWSLGQGQQRLADVLQAQRQAGLQRIQNALAQAAAQGSLRSGIEPAVAALGVFALVEGLMQQWLRQPGAFGLATVGASALQTHLAGVLVG
jgi:AcrR family transcriptional regulator